MYRYIDVSCDGIPETATYFEPVSYFLLICLHSIIRYVCDKFETE